MKVIQQNCETHPTLQEAQDGLHGLSHLTGFVVGYVDEKDNRPVAFFVDAHPGSPLGRGQHRRELVFAVPSEPKQSVSLAPIFDAINKGKDMTRG
jgi:hypothetical protein